MAINGKTKAVVSGLVAAADTSEADFMLGMNDFIEQIDTDSEKLAQTVTIGLAGDVNTTDNVQSNATFNLADGDVSVTLQTSMSNNVIDTAQLINESVTTDKLGPDAVTSAKIGDSEVTGDHIVDNAINHERLADNAVLTANIFNGSITDRKLNNINASNVGEEDELLASNGSGGFKFVSGVVNASAFADGSCDTDVIADGAVITSKIGDDQVTLAKMANNSVGTSQLVNDSVTSDKLATNSVTADAIGANAVGSSEISAGAVGTDEILLGGSGHWTFNVGSDNRLDFLFNGSVVFSVSSNGALISANDITAFGSP